MIHSFKKPVFISIALLVSVGLIGGILWFTSNKDENTAYTLTNPDRTEHTVQLTPTGFVPEELVIRQGEKVIFNNSEDYPFWPASSLHPNHEIYPEFDSMERIIPPENWEFVFDKVGRWKYHDHINAHFTGVITVIDPNAPTQAQVATGDGLEACTSLTGYQKQQCWDEQLEIVLRDKGLEAALAFFVDLYKTEPDVPKACHEWGHSLGEASYAVYKETGELMLEPEASYCGYGYFHSFIAELVKDTGSFDEVLAFCDAVQEELKDELSGVEGNCVHGVGHGTTAWLLENPENWGQFQKTADEGTAICEKIYSEAEALENCYDGVYNELHLDLFNDEYGLSFADFMAKDDPFWICHEQEDRHKRACYFEFVGIFWNIFDLDFMKALTYVANETHDIEKNGPNVIAKIAADWIQFDIVEESQERNIVACRTLQEEYLFEACMHGIANGFIQHGEPNNLHVKAFAFCGADYLTEGERDMCYRGFMGMLEWHYTDAQFKDACTLVPEESRIESCLSALRAS